jgi:uncharacterized protein (TIGR04255 family)
VSSPRENAPLVELIAELRWTPATLTDAQIGDSRIGPTFITAHTNAFEEFFMRFGGEAHILSHTETERLVPGGFPIIAHQPVYRFKRSESGETRSLYQIGAGLFSANAVPPYKSWTTFEPVVKSGVEALLRSRCKEEKNSSFTAISLRYIDAFGPSHTGGRDVGNFLAEVLGMQVTIPVALSQHLQSDAVAKPMVQLQIPMQNGLVMNIAVGEGAANSQPAIIMDTSVSTTLTVEANIEAVMAYYELAHDAIASSFSQLVRPIDHLMPIKAE